MKLGVFIGRFQVPYPHEGHLTVIQRLFESCDRVLILVGSANRSISIKNPYSFMHRSNALTAAIIRMNTGKLFDIKPLNDYEYSNSQWMADVAATVADYTEPDTEVFLFGHWKEGNDYLTWFPQFNYVNVDSEIPVSGTQVRNQLFEEGGLPERVMDDMRYFRKESQLFENYPFPESLNFNCADAVLECLSHVLLIKRGHPPGKGNWALPGGFKNRNETFRDCAFRELVEETNVRIPEKVLRGSVIGERLFDSPTRGSGGIPRNTYAVHIRVAPNPDGSLPRANGADDAVDARWVPIATALNDYSLHDDHGDIISEMTGVKPVIAYKNPRFI